MVVEIVEFINDIPDAIRMIPAVFDFIVDIVGAMDAEIPDDVLDFVVYEDGSVEIVD